MGGSLAPAWFVGPERFGHNPDMSGGVTTLSRLLRLLLLIQGSKRWTAALLADELGVAERTVYRDLNRLRDSGVPVSYDAAAGGYRIARPFFLPPIDLTAEESCALMLLTERVGGAEALPMTRPAASAMHKLRAALPEALRDALDELMPRVTVHLAAAEPDGSDDVWSIISWAIAHRRTLSCRYDAVNSSDDASGSDAFRFDPYELYFGQRAWYAIGRRHDRDDHQGQRTLRLSRFTDVRPTEQHFELPEDFSLDEYFGQAWRMIPGDRRRHRIRLRFDAAMADTVAGAVWHRTQQEELDDDGGVTLSFEIDGLDEIVWWILGYGPHCVVEEPTELRDRVAELADATARRYVR